MALRASHQASLYPSYPQIAAATDVAISIGSRMYLDCHTNPTFPLSILRVPSPPIYRVRSMSLSWTFPSLAFVHLVSKALIENPNLINWWLTFKAFYGLVALICGNGYIVGINQIYDIGIDKVNKPYLPIAAGDLSVQSAWIIVISFAAARLMIVAWNFGPFITCLYCLGLFLGTIYSVPPFRLKRYPVPAFLIIAMVRGFLLNFGVYYATQAALGLTFKWSKFHLREVHYLAHYSALASCQFTVTFITTFVIVFALVIAITKDLPDVEGDRKFQISTLATKLGVRNITFLGSGLLLVNYIGAIAAAIYMPQVFTRNVIVPTHALLALGLIFQAFILIHPNYRSWIEHVILVAIVDSGSIARINPLHLFHAPGKRI